ncbi:MAG: Threonine--tRNA ligase 2 [candidate division BRC1 bacterium ADurb.BinA364]|nr:MAG: Threonine--tRNA ligase 2 [candidate division BRC1 bacterium ADurb.BinA364]
MISLTLPDGKTIEANSGATLLDAAKSIGEGLARAALAGKIDGQMADLATPLTRDASIELLTWRDEEGREVFRHTASHVMAQAVLRLHPEAKLAIGPAIADGFYYDIAFPQPISAEDLEKIEAEMKKIVAAKYAPKRVEMPIDDALRRFRATDDRFKVELLEELKAKGETTVSLYEQGEFADLCRGPHLPNTGMIKAFKLLSLAGAYWRGDEKNEMLTRIYGACFPDKKELEEHLRILEEAKKRDHRKIGKELKLFAFHDEGPGFPFFLPNGVILYETLMAACRAELKKRNYVEIKTPVVLNEDLWHRSGHWDNYKENMYFIEIDEKGYALKPMNCPGGLLVFNQDLHSYRELPLRVAEFGLVHRHELSGVLHGLFRVRCFTQDDAHHFCAEEQLKGEIRDIINLVFHIYAMVGFENWHVELSTRPAKSIGSDEIWEKATAALQETLEEMNIAYQLNPGDGAFYGPKIDFHIQDCLKRTWQCGTIQVDFSMPERFDLSYIGADGEKHRPVMVHRAIFGSIERFLGILTEHWAGDFPLWLAPVQAIVLPISSDQAEYARQCQTALAAAGIRAEIDATDEKIGKKIREAELRKIPLMLIAGRQEAESGQIAPRRRHVGDMGAMPLARLIEIARKEIDARATAPMAE